MREGNGAPRAPAAHRRPASLGNAIGIGVGLDGELPVIDGGHSMRSAWTTVAVLGAMACACQGRRKDIEAYEQAMCACKDAKCVIAVDAKVRPTLQRPMSFFEKHFVSGEADRAASDAYRRADACA